MDETPRGGTAEENKEEVSNGDMSSAMSVYYVRYYYTRSYKEHELLPCDSFYKPCLNVN